MCAQVVVKTTDTGKRDGERPGFGLGKGVLSLFELSPRFPRRPSRLVVVALWSAASALACSGGAFRGSDEQACDPGACAADEPVAGDKDDGGTSSSGGSKNVGSPSAAGSAQAGTSAAASAGGGGMPASGTGGSGPGPSAGAPQFSHAGQGGDSGGEDGLPDFPATPVLDDFNRLGVGIGLQWLGGAEKYSLKEQALWCAFCGGAALWSTPFGSEQEVFATYAGFDPTAMEINLVLKAQLLTDCELIEVLYSPAEATARVAYCVSGAWTDSEKVPLMLHPGDQFGGRAHADGTVELFVNGTSVASIDASGFPHQEGRIGVNGLSGPAGNRWDDFGGGNWQK